MAAVVQFESVVIRPLKPMTLPPVKTFAHMVVGAVFIFFLLESTPHRVHHVFDQTAAAECVVFSVTQACHLKPSSGPRITLIQLAVGVSIFAFEVWIPYVWPSPFSQRAPPSHK